MTHNSIGVVIMRIPAPISNGDIGRTRDMN